METKVNKPQDDLFLTTRWTMVMTAQKETSCASQQALEGICQTYWLETMKAVKTMTPEEVGKRAVQKEYHRWREADKAKIESMHKSRIENVERMLALAWFAENNGYKVDQHFSSEKIQKQLEELKALTSEKMRQLMMEQFEKYVDEKNEKQKTFEKK